MTAVLLAAFAHVTFISDAQNALRDENKNIDEVNILDHYVSNLHIFLTSEFEFEEKPIYDNVFYVRILFAFTIGILLLNILIAVISNEFTEVMANSKRAFWKNRLVFIVEITSTLSWLSSFLCRCRNSKQSDNDLSSGKGDDDTIDTDDDFSTTSWVYKDNVERFDFLEPMFVGMKGTVFEEKFKDGHCHTRRTKRLVNVTSWFWKHWEENEKPPSFLARMSTFFAFSEVDQIVLPGKAWVNMMVGLKLHEEAGGVIGQILWGLCYSMNAVGAAIMFPLGFITAGLAWPYKFRKNFFSIKEEVNDTELERLLSISQKHHENLQRQIEQLRRQ